MESAIVSLDRIIYFEVDVSRRLVNTDYLILFVHGECDFINQFRNITIIIIENIYNYSMNNNYNYIILKSSCGIQRISRMRRATITV